MESEEATERLVQPFQASFDVCVSHAKGSSGGCLLFIRRALSPSDYVITVDEVGRLIVCDFVMYDISWRIICVYCPNVVTERKEFFASLRHVLNCARKIVLLGDFNCVCETGDRSSTNIFRDSSALVLRDMIDEYYLHDVATFQNKIETLSYTHFCPSSNARLDRAYVSVDLLTGTDEYKVLPVFFSDHALVTFTLGKARTAKSRFCWELWKFNVKLLDDESFTNRLEKVLANMTSGYFVNSFESWEITKQEIKLAALERSNALKYLKDAEEKLLQADLKRLFKLECEFPGKYINDIKITKASLAATENEKYKGAIIRSRAETFLLGEQPTKRALSREKQYASKKKISEIEYRGLISTDEGIIAQAFSDYYSQLFQRDEALNTMHFENVLLELMPRLDDETTAWLEQPIEISEISAAIDELKVGKTPGPDGLSTALYKKYKNILAQQLHKVLADSYKTKLLPPSFLNSHTVLIPKVDDAEKLRSVKNYRPIALSNVDYKIFMKVLARRLQSVIHRIVGSHQTCGIKGRTIFTNVHCARSILECCDMELDQVAMIQIDLEKAFDRVQHSVLYGVLKHIGVGQVILNGVEMAYSGCTTQLIVNGRLSEPIPILSSVRQGCPLSPLLFNIYLEPFCLSIIHNKNIHGFRLHAIEVKLLAYADDVAVFCHDKSSISEAVSTVKTFCELTGASVNWEKCVGFWHGSWATKPEQFEDINFMLTPSSYLGVPLQHYKRSNAHWSAVIDETRRTAQKWEGCAFSVFTRATICNVFLIAKIWYVLQVISCSRINIQKLHRVFAVFIWQSSWERLSRDNLFCRVSKGGLSLSHLWVKQIVSRFMFLRDQVDPFLRTVIQTRLSEQVPLFVVSSYNHGFCRLSAFLSEVVTAFQILSVRFSLEYLSGVTRKRLTHDLYDVLFPVPLYRIGCCERRDQDVLRRVKRMHVQPSLKTFFFKLHTNTLPVKKWLKDKGIFVPWGDHCFLCKKPETIEHVFIECWDALFFWDVLQRTLKKDLPVTSHGIRFLNTDPDDTIPLDMIMLIGLHSIWKSRMAVRNADVFIRPVRKYFTETICELTAAYKTAFPTVEWLPYFEELKGLKEF